LDTFLVRTIVVPALAALFGEASWWPGKVHRPGGEPDSTEGGVPVQHRLAVD
jgi:RND superfamily putative drug exporter